MMLRSFEEERVCFKAISLLDGRRLDMFANQFAFAAQTHLKALTCHHMIYDHVGLARSNPHVLGLKRDYSVWIHGVEVLRNMTSHRMAALKNAKCILVNSNHTLRKFEEKFFELPNAYVCPLATENTCFSKKRTKRLGPPTVGILSRITNDGFLKGHLHLIDAWSKILEKIANARLVIAGAGGGLANLQNDIARSPASKNIEVLGRIDGNALEEFWNRIDVFAMPSRVEGFGLVYVEAMQRGIPVIASIHDAGQEVNMDGITGFNVNLDQPNALTKVLLTLLCDEALHAQMGNAAFIHWEKHYQFSAFKKRFLDIVLNEILA